MSSPRAEAITLDNPDGSSNVQMQAWADSSQIRTPNLVLTVHDGSVDECSPGLGGCFSGTSGIWLGDGPEWWRKPELLHEIGHAVATYCLSWRQKHALKPLLGFARSTMWWSPSRPGPTEYFAEAYRQLGTFSSWAAWSAANAESGTFTDQYGYVPDANTWLPIARIVRRAISFHPPAKCQPSTTWPES